MFGHLPIVFDSTTVAERDRFAFAREEYGRKALKVDLEALGDAPFRLRMRAEVYGSVRVAIIESTPYRVTRTRPLIADGDDRIGLLFPLVGRFGGEQGGRTVAARRGEATTMVADRTGWFGTPTGGTFLTIRADPELVKRNSQDLNRIRSGVTVRPSRLGFDLIRGYLSVLNRSGADPSPDFREMAGRHLAEIGTHAFGGSEASPHSSQHGEGLRAARLAAALDHMAARFMDPSYDVSACAGHLGISVRYLQVLLEAGGTRFSKELTRLRLERAHNLLSDPLNAALRVTDIVYDSGFSDLSHFNRQFRAHFGESPTSVRGSSRAAPGLEPVS
jgi:AraC-like DNA-binding protein